MNQLMTEVGIELLGQLKIANAAPCRTLSNFSLFKMQGIMTNVLMLDLEDLIQKTGKVF